MFILETLAPLILLIALGAGLAHIRFLGREFMADLNKLAFWIALPALLFVSAYRAAAPGGSLWLMLGIMIAATLLINFIAWLACFPLGLPKTARGTLMQASFRGNLAYIGVPVLTYGFGPNNDLMGTAVILMVTVMSTYNILAVIVLQQPGSGAEKSWIKIIRSILSNPLLIAGFLGLVFSIFRIPLPGFILRSLDSLGGAAVPIAQLCIGGSLVVTSMQGRRSWIVMAALLKVLVLPLIVWTVARFCGLGLEEQRIVVVLSCCPTAAASYIMAKEMGGDEALASGSIVLSTLLSSAAIAGALWLTSP